MRTIFQRDHACIGYAVLAAAAFTARTHERVALFQVAAVALMLLFIGIHDAWDNATNLKRSEGQSTPR